MSEKKFCSLWGLNWAESMPDSIVRKVIDRGVINPECLSEERRKRLGLAIGEEREEQERGDKEVLLLALFLIPPTSDMRLFLLWGKFKIMSRKNEEEINEKYKNF